MDELEKALIAAGVALLGAITVVIGIVGTYAAKYLSTKGELAIEQLKRDAADKAVLATEDETRGKTTSPADKLALATRMADAATPKDVKVHTSDVRAAVTRYKASIPTPPSAPPIHGTLGSSAPPESGAEHPTFPRPPRTPDALDPSKQKAPLR